MRTIALLVMGAGMGLCQTGTVNTGPLGVSYLEAMGVPWVQTVEPQVFRLSAPQKMEAKELEAKISAAERTIADAEGALSVAQWELRQWEEHVAASEGEHPEIVLTGDLSIVGKTFSFSKHYEYLLEVPKSTLNGSFTNYGVWQH